MGETDDRLIILADHDTIAVARCEIRAGERLLIGGREVMFEYDLSIGHKLALVPMVVDQKVLKYGVPIGSVTAEIAVGDHVHLHNIKSDYTPTYSLADAQHVKGEEVKS